MNIESMIYITSVSIVPVNFWLQLPLSLVPAPQDFGSEGLLSCQDGSEHMASVLRSQMSKEVSMGSHGTVSHVVCGALGPQRPLVRQHGHCFLVSCFLSKAPRGSGNPFLCSQGRQRCFSCLFPSLGECLYFFVWTVLKMLLFVWKASNVYLFSVS